MNHTLLLCIFLGSFVLTSTSTSTSSSLETINDNFDSKSLSNFFNDIDNAKKTVRKAKIFFRNALTDFEMLVLGEQLDNFLTPRLWWNVLVEPFAWHKKNRNEIILTRFDVGFEQHLRLQSSIQYPDSKTCDKSLLIVDRFDGFHVAWGNNLGIKATTHNKFPYTPATSYNSRSNDPSAQSESVAWISAHECNTTNNKWECAFLPRTNCTLPDQLTKCTGINCVYNLPETVNAGSVFSSANASGIALTKGEYEKYVRTPMAHPPANNLQASLAKYNQPPTFKMSTAYNKSFPITIRPKADSKSTIYIFGAIMRNNYRFRSLIAEEIHTFYHKNNMNFSTRCVSAQVRRGDRVIKGVDMVQLCKNATKPITEQNPVNYCLDFDGKLQNCGVLKDNFSGGVAFDKGCESPVSFGAVTVDMLIKAAKQLAPPEVKTLFVSTDDEAWLESEKKIAKNQHPEWAVVNLEAPKPPPDAKIEDITSVHGRDRFSSGYEYMRYKSGAKSGAFFLASLQLTQQCEAFMGHYTSTVPHLFMQAMCYKSRNGQLTGVCPPVYDLRTGIV